MPKVWPKHVVRRKKCADGQMPAWNLYQGQRLIAKEEGVPPAKRENHVVCPVELSLRGKV